MSQTLRLRLRQHKSLVHIVVVALLVLVGYLVYMNLKFHVVRTNPDTSDVAYFAPFFKVEFNDELSKQGLSVSSSPNIIKNYEVRGKTLHISPTLMAPEKSYTITIHSISNTKGEKITNKSFTFTTKNVNAETLPEDQRRQLLIDQDKKPDAYTDPILLHLPHSTLEYTLEADYDSDDNLIVRATIILSAADIRSDQRDETIDKYKQNINKYFLSKGIDPTKYKVEYSITEPSLY